MNPSKLIEKSSRSRYYLWLLNLVLKRMIPFNKPHKFRITRIGTGQVEIKLPFVRNNMNHIKGLHACSIATLAEFCTGLAMLTRLDPKEYRIILKHLEIEYHFQGKSEASAKYEVSESWFEEHVFKSINQGIPAEVCCQTDIIDKDGNKLATGNITWQIKSWESVRTKL